MNRWPASKEKFHFRFQFLPLANEVCEGYVFTGVCLSTGGCLPHCMLGYTSPGPVADTPPWADTPLGRHPPWADTSLCAVHAGIRSTSGWYASHWNAFLFSMWMGLQCDDRILGADWLEALFRCVVVNRISYRNQLRKCETDHFTTGKWIRIRTSLLLWERKNTFLKNRYTGSRL